MILHPTGRNKWWSQTGGDVTSKQACKERQDTSKQTLV